MMVFSPFFFGQDDAAPTQVQSFFFSGQNGFGAGLHSSAGQVKVAVGGRLQGWGGCGHSCFFGGSQHLGVLDWKEYQVRWNIDGCPRKSENKEDVNLRGHSYSDRSYSC